MKNKCMGLLGILLVLSISFFGCSGGGGGSSTPPPTPPTREVFVINSGIDSVSVFDASLSGNVNALRQFGIITGLSAPLGIAVDTVNNEIFVTNSLINSITVYGRTDTGNITPARTISGASTGLSSPNGIALP